MGIRQHIIRFTSCISRRRTQIALGPMLLAARNDEIDATVKRLNLDEGSFRTGYCMGAAATVGRMEYGAFDAGTMALVQRQG